MGESDNILTKLQDLLVCLIPQLNKFPRDQKFVLGDRIETKPLEISPLALNQFKIKSSWVRSIRATFFIGSMRLRKARQVSSSPETRRRVSRICKSRNARSGL